jgi:signal transduction histidine kinase/CheY-like chemotaxis protein
MSGDHERRESSLAGADDGAAGEANWRETLLHVLLLSAAALATLSFPVIGWLAVTRVHPGWLTLMFGLYVTIVGAAALPRLPYTVRAVALLVGLCGVGVLGFLRVGFQVGPGLGSALMVVLAGLLLGRGALLAAFALTLVAMLGLGAYHVLTHASSMAPGIGDPTLFRNWVRVAIVYALFCGVLATAVTFVISHLERALTQRTEALKHLRAAHAQRREAEHALDDAQRTILQMQKMEAVGRLAGGVAHDFNNVLVVILGWADLLRSKQGDPACLEEGLNEIVAAGNRASALTRQLLAFARKSALLPRPVVLTTLLAEVTAMLERLLPANIALKTHVADDLPPILADEAQIHQALLNLCVNARDAMPGGGTLEISAVSRDSAGAPGLASRTWVALSVRDTGAGMDEATQARAFEPFFTTKGELGTGLGLSSVYGIVQQTQGYVQLESELCKGTTVTLLLPPFTAELALSLQSQTTPPPLMAAAGTVLIAEDEPAVRTLMVTTLAAAGYTVVTAPNGSAALELARRYRGKIDLLCADGIMPGISSATLVRDFRALFPDSRVLFCSGHIDRALPQLAPAGAAYLNKPFTSETLVRAVGELLAADGRAA